MKIPGVNPLLFVLSGPSGVGKDVVLAGIKKKKSPLHFAVTATTRTKREKEIDGIDYHFISKSQFQSMIEKGEFLEWANVYGNFYGVPKSEMRQATAKGQDMIVKVDVQGASTIKKAVPQAVFIFLAPPTMKDLQDRLIGRKTERDIDLEVRMQAAEREMGCIDMFDYMVVNYNDGIEAAVCQIEAIITAEKCRVSPRSMGII